MKRYQMDVEGMTCDYCNLHVGRALERAGAREVTADWRNGEARFAADEESKSYATYLSSPCGGAPTSQAGGPEIAHLGDP